MLGANATLIERLTYDRAALTDAHFDEIEAELVRLAEYDAISFSPSDMRSLEAENDDLAQEVADLRVEVIELSRMLAELSKGG